MTDGIFLIHRRNIKMLKGKTRRFDKCNNFSHQ